MSRARILVTGATGQVGFELARQFSLDGEVLTPTRNELDLTDGAAVQAYLATHRPTLILNAAAYTAVDKAESDSASCWAVNERLPQLLAAYAAEVKVPLVHFSSDYVYPGDGQQAWHEHSDCAPLSSYGASKLAGDRAISERLEGHDLPFYILRTSWVYSARGNNFMKTMLRLGQQRQQLSIVNDQIGAPTPARMLAQLAQRLLAANAPSGIYHAAPRGETSWHGFALEIFRLAGLANMTMLVTPAAVTGIPTEDYPTPAKRPKNSRLSLKKIEQTLAIELPCWQSELALTFAEYIDKES